MSTQSLTSLHFPKSKRRCFPFRWVNSAELGRVEDAKEMKHPWSAATARVREWQSSELSVREWHVTLFICRSLEEGVPWDPRCRMRHDTTLGWPAFPALAYRNWPYWNIERLLSFAFRTIPNVRQLKPELGMWNIWALFYFVHLCPHSSGYMTRHKAQTVILSCSLPRFQ